MSAPANVPASAQGAVLFPGNLRANPRLSQWLRFSRDGRVEVSPGKVEIGQGILTALAQIVADELDVELARLRVVPASTARSPNEGVTSGSLSVQDCGLALRYVSAEARALFLAAAAERLGIPAEALSVADGEISGPGNTRTSYWELAEDVSLDRDATCAAEPKPPAARSVAGSAAARLDIPDKVLGRARFIHDLVLRGMLHGRVLRPEAPRARLVALEEGSARVLPGFVALVRDGSFVGVVAQTEHAAEAALAHLGAGASWSAGEALPDEAGLKAWLKSQPAETKVVDSREAARPALPARTMRRAYSRPYLAHASIAPSCAVAQWSDSGLHVWSHCQGVFHLRADLALVLAIPAEKIVVEHVEGAGCYGHNGADDVALDAALLARGAGGRPVRVQWSRADELARAPFGAAQLVEIEADLDERGEIVAWRHDIWGNGHVARPGRNEIPTLLAASELQKPFPRFIAANPPLATGGGADRNAVPLYDLPAWRITNHRLLAMPLRTSSLRSLGAFANVFAIECFLDELAAERGEDPLALRLRYLRDPRARAVLEAAAARAGWGGPKREGFGRGLAFARYKNTGAYCAVVAEVEGEAEIRVRRLIIAVDVGEAINPDGVVNQVEGGAIQATSWTLKEAVRFDRERVTSNSWESYPILTFSEVPAVEVEIIPRPDEKPVGAGEAAHGPTAAAVANAVHDLLRVRVRDLPITRERVIAAMEAA